MVGTQQSGFLLPRDLYNPNCGKRLVKPLIVFLLGNEALGAVYFPSFFSSLVLSSLASLSPSPCEIFAILPNLTFSWNGIKSILYFQPQGSVGFTYQFFQNKKFIEMKKPRSDFFGGGDRVSGRGSPLPLGWFRNFLFGRNFG